MKIGYDLYKNFPICVLIRSFIFCMLKSLFYTLMKIINANFFYVFYMYISFIEFVNAY